MSASYAITFRDDGRGRLANLMAVLRWLSPLRDLEVLVVEQAAAPALRGATLPANCRAIFAFNDTLFNKAWGLNVGVRHATGEVVVLVDADVLMPREALAAGVAACRDHYDAVNPYGTLVDLTAEETREVLNGRDDLLVTRTPRQLNRAGLGEVLCFCGGIFVIRKAVYDELGGFDERFEGWGGEDDAMSLKLLKTARPVATHDRPTAFHLWHDRSHARTYGQPHYRRNLELLIEYRRMTPRDLVALCARQRGTTGDLGKYRR